MAQSNDTYLHGLIRLSDIPKEAIQTLQSGKKAVYVDMKARKTPSSDGKTHYLCMRVKNAQGAYETIYLGDFEEKTFQTSQNAAPTPAPTAPAYRPASAPAAVNDEDDLPF